jgi:hypothetical protein
MRGLITPRLIVVALAATALACTSPEPSHVTREPVHVVRVPGEFTVIVLRPPLDKLCGENWQTTGLYYSVDAVFSSSHGIAIKPIFDIVDPLPSSGAIVVPDVPQMTMTLFSKKERKFLAYVSINSSHGVRFKKPGSWVFEVREIDNGRLKISPLSKEPQGDP